MATKQESGADQPPTKQAGSSRRATIFAVTSGIDVGTTDVTALAPGFTPSMVTVTVAPRDVVVNIPAVWNS